MASITGASGAGGGAGASCSSRLTDHDVDDLHKWATTLHGCIELRDLHQLQHLLQQPGYVAAASFPFYTYKVTTRLLLPSLVTPFVLAVTLGYGDAVASMLSAGVDPNSKCGGHTPLGAAVQLCRHDITALLVKHKAVHTVPGAVSKPGQSSEASTTGASGAGASCSSCLTDHAVRDLHRWATTLHGCIELRDLHQLQHLLQQPGYVAAASFPYNTYKVTTRLLLPSVMTPFVLAVTLDCFDAVASMLSAGVDPNSKCGGHTPLGAAVQLCRHDITALLVTCEAVDINDGGTYTGTPLMMACEQDSPSATQLLTAREDLDIMAAPPLFSVHGTDVTALDIANSRWLATDSRRRNWAAKANVFFLNRFVAAHQARGPQRGGLVTSTRQLRRRNARDAQRRVLVRARRRRGGDNTTVTWGLPANFWDWDDTGQLAGMPNTPSTMRATIVRWNPDKHAPVRTVVRVREPARKASNPKRVRSKAVFPAWQIEAIIKGGTTLPPYPPTESGTRTWVWDNEAKGDGHWTE